MKHVHSLTNLMKKDKKGEQNERGNTIYRMFMPDERYMVDFADDFTEAGWLQFDTDQDAHYFGVWVNPSKLLTLNYCEGDWTLVECSDVQHYNAEIQDAIEFYGEGRICLVVDADNNATEYRQERSGFLIGGAS